MSWPDSVVEQLTEREIKWLYESIVQIRDAQPQLMATLEAVEDEYLVRNIREGIKALGIPSHSVQSYKASFRMRPNDVFYLYTDDGVRQAGHYIFYSIRLRGFLLLEVVDLTPPVPEAKPRKKKGSDHAPQTP